MSNRDLHASTGIESYDRARWGGWLPERRHIVVQPMLNCLLQSPPAGKLPKQETTVQPNQAHHVLLFWTQGVPNLNFTLDQGPQRVRMGNWDGLHIPKGMPSWWESTAQSAQGLFHIHLASHVVDQALIDSAEDGSSDCSSALDRQAVNDSLRQVASLMLVEAKESSSPPRLLWESYAVLLAYSLVRSGPVAHSSTKGGLAPWQTRRCTEFLHEHAHENVDLKQLAAQVDLSPFHFARAFKQSTGVPPHRYQTTLRLARAKALLEVSDISVTEIALKVGYESSQALARLFRREVGLSPSDYRRQCAR